MSILLILVSKSDECLNWWTMLCENIISFTLFLCCLFYLITNFVEACGMLDFISSYGVALENQFLITTFAIINVMIYQPGTMDYASISQ